MEQEKTTSISVIIAVYNGEETIKRAIDSILKQTRPADEIIIIDDGSTDNTRDIVTGYHNKVIYKYQDNSGVSIARNAGVEMALSEWVCFLDADDWYYPDRIKYHMDMIQDDPCLDFLTGNFDYIDEHGVFLRHSMQSTAVGKKLLSLAGEQLTVTMTGDLIGDFIEQHFGDTHTLTVKRKDFLQLGGYPEGISVCEDVNFLIRLCAISEKIGVFIQPMAAYFIHSGSVTRSNPLKAQQETLYALKRLQPELKVLNENLLSGLSRAIRHARLDLAYTLLKMNKKFPAFRAVLPLIYEKPGIRSLKDILSITIG